MAVDDRATTVDGSGAKQERILGNSAPAIGEIRSVRIGGTDILGKGVNINLRGARVGDGISAGELDGELAAEGAGRDTFKSDQRVDVADTAG